MKVVDCLQWSEQRLQQRFLVLRKLGEGTYGKVQLALNKETNQEVAVKTIKKARIESEEDMLRIRREIQIMASIRHPHIIHINEVFETRQKIVIVMQYASGGELYDYLCCHHKLPEEEARRLFRQIASAIYYCHKNQICHRDLKLENILLDEEGNAQIADFGLSNMFDERRRMSTFCGSPLYASPEIVKGTPYKGPEVDCWSLGVLLYTLIYGTMPFDGRNFKELVSQISKGKYEEPINKSNASDLIRFLLTPDLSKRATISDVCKDKWVNNGYNDFLYNTAEQMTVENYLNGKNLDASKLSFEKVIQNVFDKSSSNVNSVLEAQKGKMSLLPVLKKPFNSVATRTICQKPNLYEQILNCDVRFIMNKILATVDSAHSINRIQNISVKENVLIRNSEQSPKIDSAYVIPIFEVTSVVPKLVSKMSNSNNNFNTKQFLTQNKNSNKFNSLAVESLPSMEVKKNSRVKNKKREQSRSKENSPEIEIFSEISEVNKIKYASEELNCNLQIQTGDQTHKRETFTCKESNPEDKSKLMARQGNILLHTSNLKNKNTDENIFHHKFRPTFRTKNRALSIARLFSLNFETSNHSPEHKKCPGKIVIPATFNPLTIQNTICERKEILIFPTISVSENKEKIEKKIEKIKKAALNMNLIRRSNSKNRLKIQKYLKSQAKKIQDLVLDEQRNVTNNLEQIRRCETTSVISDNYFGRYLNPFNIRQHHRKKINLIAPDNVNINVSNNEWKLDAISRKRWVSGINLEQQSDNFRFLNISKSKSEEIRFSDSCLNLSKFFDNKINEKFNNPSVDSPSMLQESQTKECCQELHKTILVNSSLNDVQRNEKLNKKVKSSTHMDQIDKVKLIDKAQLSVQPMDLLKKACMKRLLSEPCLRNLGTISIYDTSVNELLDYENKLTDTFRKSNSSKEVSRKGERQNRRYTLSCIMELANKNYFSQENVLKKKEEFHKYLWMLYVNKKFLRGKIELLRSPNRYKLPDDKNTMDSDELDNKSVDEINKQLYEASLSNTMIYGLKEVKSTFLKKLLKSSITQQIFLSDCNRKSVSEETLSHSKNVENSPQIKRKISLPHGNEQRSLQKTPVLSKFLYELEKGDKSKNMKGKNFVQRSYSRNTQEFDKKSKTENKSFLQFLSLKRIQEAEKELHRKERNNENEDERSGSLLEALKTHGYKNVISTRFQTKDIDNIRYPTNTPRIPDIPRTYFNDCEATLCALYYESGGFDPKFSKQFVQEATNLSENYLDSTEINVPIIPEESILNRRLLLKKEPSESFEMSKESILNGNPSCNTTNVPRTSSMSDDDESVQDRIWRKSFYSRFNNSILSRKDRSKIFDTNLLPEKIDGLNSPLKCISRESFQWPLKRAATMRPQTSRKNELEKAFQTSNSSKQTIPEKTSNVNKIVGRKFEDTKSDQ